VVLNNLLFAPAVAASVCLTPLNLVSEGASPLVPKVNLAALLMVQAILRTITVPMTGVELAELVGLAELTELTELMGLVATLAPYLRRKEKVKTLKTSGLLLTLSCPILVDQFMFVSYRSTSPKTMSCVPMIVTRSAIKWPLLMWSREAK